MPGPLDYWREGSPKCPHCKSVQQEYADVAQWNDGDVWSIECEDCRKTFWVLTTTAVNFSSAVSEQDAEEENCGPQEAVEPVRVSPEETDAQAPPHQD